MSISLSSLSSLPSFPMVSEGQISQEITLSAPSCVPEISAKTMQFENGFRVYFLNRQNWNSDIALASFRLIVHAGTFAEEESERGVAHLLEHCVYLGTEELSQTEIRAIHKDLGCQDGADANAFTLPGATVYQFDNIPTKEKEKVHKCLNLLRELSSFATFPEELVEKERSIVLDEELRRKGGNQDFMQHRMRTFFSENPYAHYISDNMGKSIKECSKEELRQKLKDFSDKWYDPTKMSLVVVGDFGDEENQKMHLDFIQHLFATIPSKSLSDPFVFKSVQQRNAFLHTKFEHVQITDTSIEIWREKPYKKDRLFVPGSGLNSLLQRIEYLAFANILNKRFQRLANTKGGHIYDAVVSVPEKCFFKGAVYAHIYLNPKLGKVEEAYKQFLEEIQRINLYGVHKSEFESERACLLSENERAICEEPNDSHVDVIEEFVAKLIENKRVRDPQARFKITRTLIQQLSLERINLLARQWWDIFFPHTQNRGYFVTVTAPDKKLLPDVTANMQKIFFEVQKEKIEDIVEREYDESWIPAMPKEAPVIKYEAFEAVGCEKFSFDNGITVILKPTLDKSAKVYLTFVQTLGSRNLSREEHVNLVFAIAVLNQCGLANCTAEEVLEKINPSPIENIEMNFLNLGWQLEAELDNSSGLELALQCFYLYFTDFRVIYSEEFENGFRVAIEQEKSRLHDHLRSSKGQIHESITSLMWGNQSPLYSKNIEDLESVDLQKARLLLESLFRYIEGGTLIVCGAFDRQEVVSWTRGYMGGIPKSQISNPFPNIAWQEVSMEVEKVTEIHYLGNIEDRTDANILLPIPKFPNGIVNSYMSHFASLSHIYFLDEMRFGNQETYALSVSHIPNPADLGIGYLKIAFASLTERHKDLKTSIEKVFKQLINLNPEEIEPRLEFVKQLEQKSRAESIRTTAYFAVALKLAILNKKNIENIALYSDWESCLSVKDVQEFFNILKEGWKVRKEFVVHPKKQAISAYESSAKRRKKQ